MSGYQMPPLAAGEMPINLVPEAEVSQKLITPDTVVLCRNRGYKAHRDTFDGRHYVIPAGPQTFFLPYGAAKHFQGRLIVPGTRVIGEGGFVSYVAILGIDPEDDCAMFSRAEFDEQQTRPEGLDRSALDPERQSVTLLQTATARGAGSAKTGRRNEVIGAPREAVFSPPPGGSLASSARLLGDENGLDAAPETGANLEPVAPAPAAGGRRR